MIIPDNAQLMFPHTMTLLHVSITSARKHGDDLAVYTKYTCIVLLLLTRNTIIWFMNVRCKGCSCIQFQVN